jgi:hypothetical protein
MRRWVADDAPVEAESNSSGMRSRFQTVLVWGGRAILRSGQAAGLGELAFHGDRGGSRQDGQLRSNMKVDMDGRESFAQRCL